MASKKAGGSTKNGRDSNAKRRGVKRFGGQLVKAGEVIVRQVGTKIKIDRCDRNVGLGKDYTIYSKVPGKVTFFRKQNRTMVTVQPEQ